MEHAHESDAIARLEAVARDAHAQQRATIAAHGAALAHAQRAELAAAAVAHLRGHAVSMEDDIREESPSNARLAGIAARAQMVHTQGNATAAAAAEGEAPPS